MQMRNLFLGLILCTLAMAETDVTGKWSGGPFLLTLKQQGNAITGTAGSSAGDQYPIKNGVIEGDKITFDVGTFHMELRIEGANLKGETKMGEQTYPVILQRAEAAKAGPPPVFEVASVKPSPPGPNRGSNMHMDPGRLTCSGVTLIDLVRRAYDLKHYQISAPDWMSEERYELTATFPVVSGQEQIQQMLQALLVERFKIVVHREKKEMPVYGLVVGKTGLKLKEVEMGPGGTSMTGGKLTARKVTMARVAEVFSNQVDRPVIDMTGLTGIYEFTLEWARNENAPSENGPTVNIYAAIEQQLGLKLESRKAPIDILVVDRAEKVPIEN